MQLGRNNDAKPFFERASRLNTYIDLVRRNKVRSIELGGKGDVELAQQAIKAADELGNVWECYGWVLMTLDADKQNMALQQEEQHMEPLLKNLEHKRTLAPYNPTTKVDLSKFPLPDWKVAAASAASAQRRLPHACRSRITRLPREFPSSSSTVTTRKCTGSTRCSK